MGLVRLGGKMVVYGLALCGAAGIFGVGYYTLKATSAQPVSIQATSSELHEKQPAQQNLTDKIKQEAMKEVIGDESYRRMINNEVGAAIDDYVQNEKFIDELRKSRHFQPNYKKWIKKN